MTKGELNNLGGQVLDACITVHRELGPGLLESAYVFSLKKELELRGIMSIAEVPVPLFYKGFDTGKYYRIDLLIENEIVLEAKSVEIMHPVYHSQIISLLKLSNRCLGYLVNFNAPVLKEGFKRYVNNF